MCTQIYNIYIQYIYTTGVASDYVMIFILNYYNSITLY